jgi:hypothetical protein
MAFVESLKKEARELTLVTLYFLTCCAVFLSLKKLFLEEYGIKITVISTVVISALIIAKVVVILEKTSFGNRFALGPFIVHVIYRSLAYTAAVFVATVAERIFDGWREFSTWGEAIHHLWAGRDVDHFLAMNLAVAVWFLIYNTFSDIDVRLGEGSLRAMLLSRRSSG